MDRETFEHWFQVCAIGYWIGLMIFFAVVLYLSN
jgi:hypothetical protein